jgi:hypothetical protein
MRTTTNHASRGMSGANSRRWAAWLLVSAPLWWACGVSIDPQISFTSTSISLNPVPAPTTSTPVTLVLSASLIADPEVGGVGVSIGEAIPSASGPTINAPLASFTFPCTQAGTGSNCKATNYTMTCTVSLVAQAAGTTATKRSMDCANGQPAAVFDAGTHDFHFGANTPGGTLGGTDYDFVRLKITFE